MVLMGIGTIVGMFVLAALILMFRDRITRPRRLMPEEARAAHEARLARLTTPDWPGVEERLGRPVPKALRELYADREIVTREDFVVHDPNRPGEDGRWYVASFQPAHREAVGPTGFGVPRGAVLFATTNFGDEYHATITGDDDDTGAVYLYYHDGDDLDYVADSLREFLSWPRSVD